ncbi:Frequenin-1,Neurocalcin homolog,Neurocalcin-delta A,Neurocalcin-delta B,Neuronal calcium sensor 1,Hippocalcin-like protein 4,Neuron-specific calcium-binding protein hippocalcin,Hippocalcin-like protein 1,Neurocalcin-delta,Visinin-like protein 1,Neurocalcin [Mytilus coruscus]|uniref:EF-hand domain-containing protein n=1 Tax=Mytilus coruscus TaxID=42192 RepID=A0A6J8BQK6_MYTCO|nr:Frequenin-1,Neurocalcin homolog,Neurocalcin-delta A,Neurocalcin-delta B,Neuronal calcium sensor 1,Hippocalcin-like protein 4,Neuron-specific calcium-binding protein hippocalcin,Hippocalcin-like protein 1,Neurocalcin-delta,Visinin-like protein 1,Neurocalcin [Mytilus coruscus]
MGNQSSKKQINPKTIADLRSHIDVEFSKDEIQDWYKDFRQYLRHGETELDKTAFIKVYNSLFYGDASEFAEQVFRTFDHNGNNSVDFKEFILGLCLSGSENAEKKIKWAFNMYDIDQDGYITTEEMTHILKAICKMTGSKIPHEFNSPEDMTEKIFKILDKNSDNRISQQEFIEGADKVQILVDILQCNPDS